MGSGYHKVGDLGDLSPYKHQQPAYKEDSYVSFKAYIFKDFSVKIQLQCILYNVLCTLNNVQCKLCIV